jgi:Tfp pilus assembly protein FimT
MAVVVILAVVAAMAVPLLGDTNNTQLRQAANLLTADLGYAQVESIAHGQDLRLVVFDTVNHNYFIAATSAPTVPLTNPTDRKPYRVTFGSGRADALSAVRIQAVSVGGDNRLGFGVYGQLDQPAAATVTLAAGGRTLTLTIDPVSGEVTIGTIN